MKYLAMLNTVLEGGGCGDVIVAKLVDDLEDGEAFCCENRPDDGTQVDYTLYKLTDILKADLLEACRALLAYQDKESMFRLPANISDLRQAIAKAEGLNATRSTLNAKVILANARLIAAAPDLLEACKAFVESWEKSLQLEKTDTALRLAKQAIAKTEGEEK